MEIFEKYFINFWWSSSNKSVSNISLYFSKSVVLNWLISMGFVLFFLLKKTSRDQLEAAEVKNVPSAVSSNTIT
ncbi:hypothetical protein [Spiroplasma endosymbiont of Melieria omissa]|uniref:hypothetical protein n=1 Tax=Spiroplasma endosymbiont of Melieria omissa TaxID=3139324 RepID=UPI003CCACE47